MIYDWTAMPGPPLGELFDDRTGDRLPGSTFWCNTDTGEYRYYLTDKNGLFYVDPATSEPAVAIGNTGGPLRFEVLMDEPIIVEACK